MADPHPLTDDDRADLIAYLDGELPPEAQRRVESLLNRNPRARSEADAYKRTWDLLDYLPRPGPSADFTSRTLQRVSAVRPAPAPPAPRLPWYHRRALHSAAAAAAVLLALVAGTFIPLPTRTAPPAAIDPDHDPVMAREPRVVENLPCYLAVETMDYLTALDAPDLFGEDAPAR